MQLFFVCVFILYGVSAHKILHLKINDKCRDGPKPWYCKRSTSCKGLESAAEKHDLQLCGFEGGPIVCCPDEKTNVEDKNDLNKPADIEKRAELKVNDKCKDGPKPWYCKKSTLCKGLKSALESNNLMFCGFDGSPIVCCPDEKDGIEEEDDMNIPADVGKKAEKKCQEYAKYVYNEMRSPSLKPGAKSQKIIECGISAETLIVGGTAAKLKEFPHMALLGYKFGKNIHWFCGGSLISPRFILTAAHCNVSQSINDVVVRLGDLNINSEHDHARHIDVTITEVFDHPKYVYPLSYHDISLVMLRRDIRLGPRIRPLCLFTNRTIERKAAIASGWGVQVSSGGTTSDILQKVSLELVKDDECKITYGTGTRLPRGITSNSILCAGGKVKKDTCQGDSGGPLQITLKEPYCMYSQIGIISFGHKNSCGEKRFPGGYTRVSHYIPWIESIVWP